MTVSTATDVVVDELHALSDLRAACDLFSAIWGRAGGDAPVVPELLRAVSHAGGYVGGARRGSQLVGASVGFLGLDNGRVILHSHITGIALDAQNRGVGAALKHHQRRWARAHDIAEITWTFDPLVRRNGRFNLHALGAQAVAYLPDFYGVMDDAQNGSDATDRCLVRWDVRGDAGPRPEPALQQLIAHGADTVLHADSHDAPVVTESTASTRLCWIPEDIVTLRRTKPAAASAWRAALRAAMGSAMDAGLRGVAMSCDGWYVLAEPGDVAS